MRERHVPSSSAAARRRHESHADVRRHVTMSVCQRGEGGEGPLPRCIPTPTYDTNPRKRTFACRLARPPPEGVICMIRRTATLQETWLFGKM
jgi:hypothetical protein